MSDDDNQYAYYYAVLGGEKRPVVETNPELGFYRLRQSKSHPWMPVAIFDAEQGEEVVRVALVNGQPCDLIKTWLQCADKPVSYEAYQTRINKGAWPGDYTPIQTGEADPLGHYTHNQPVSELLPLELDNAAEWLGKIKTIKTQEEADTAGNIVGVLRKLAKEADEKHTTEKKPHLEQCRLVDAKYLPFIKRAEEGVKVLLKAITKWTDKEKDRLRQEAAREEVGTSAQPVKIKAVGGQHGKVISLHKVVRFVVVDHAAALAYFAEHPDIKEAVATLATKLGKAGTVAPGVERRETEEAK